MFYKTFLLICVVPNPTVPSDEKCRDSLLTMQTVTSCPSTNAELSIAKERKQCKRLAYIQTCSKPEKFKYHCVLNTWENETIEVCAPERFSQGFCLKFDESAASLQEIYDKDCTNYSKKCDTRFSSSDVLHYIQCNDIVRKQEASKISNGTKANENKNTANGINTVLLGLVIALVVVILMVIIGKLARWQYRRRNQARNKEKKLKDKRKKHFNTPYPVGRSRKDKKGQTKEAQVPMEKQQKLIPKAQGYDLQAFRKSMQGFSIDKFVNKLEEHGIDCLETFCSMTESDFEEMGLNKGQRRKCVLAAEYIKEQGLSWPRSINEAGTRSDDGTEEHSL